LVVGGADVVAGAAVVGGAVTAGEVVVTETAVVVTEIVVDPSLEVGVAFFPHPVIKVSASATTTAAILKFRMVPPVAPAGYRTRIASIPPRAKPP
jgi:hypothetical protein